MLRRRVFPIALIVCVSLFTASVHAIVIRHDQLDARYLELAKGFTAYGDVVEAGSTLIAPRWLLTAGHVAKVITPYTSYASVNGKLYTIDRVVMHPDYVAAGLRGRTDLALLRLTTSVEGVEPVRLHKTPDEAGQVVTFFGRGQTGNGLTGPTGGDGKMRGATNKVESVDPTSVIFLFDQPETATELEGISGPGDSGGPALLKVRGEWTIVGVSSQNKGAGQGPCRYGTTEFYARVSTAVEWIEETIRSAPESTVAWRISSPFRAWPKSRPGAVGSALIEAFNSGDAVLNEAFNQKFRDPQSLKRGTPQSRATSYAELVAKVGKLTVLEYAEDPNGRLQVLLRNQHGVLYELSLYFLDPENTRFDGYWLGVVTPPHVRTL